MDWIALLKTIALCSISIVIEALSSTKAGKSWFENLKQPKYAFSFSFWYVIGGIYYLICGILAYRAFHNTTQIYSLALILLTVIMIVNGLTNFILFKFHSLKWFYWTLFPFTLLFLGLVIILFQTDKFDACLASLYLLWLCYDVYYFYHLWKLNQG